MEGLQRSASKNATCFEGVVLLDKYPEKTKIAAGLACGAVWTVLKGDIVLCPDGTGRYRLGEVEGDYSYQPGSVLPDQRMVK